MADNNILCFCREGSLIQCPFSGAGYYNTLPSDFCCFTAGITHLKCRWTIGIIISIIERHFHGCSACKVRRIEILVFSVRVEFEVVFATMGVRFFYSCRLMAVPHTPAAHAVFEAIGIGQTHHTAIGEETGGDVIAGNTSASECLDTEKVGGVLFQVAQSDGRGLYRHLSRPCVICGLSVLVSIARDVSIGSRPRECGFSVGQVAHRKVCWFWECGIFHEGKVIYV